MPVPKVQFKYYWQSLAECVGTVSIPVDLTSATNVQVTVNCVVTGGNATAGADYTISGSTLSFSPGTTRAYIYMTVIDDSIVEGNEGITLTLSDPQNANPGSPSSLPITIQDNDAGTCS
jgi:hypothetical protein